jgi:hypothetical protein
VREKKTTIAIDCQNHTMNGKTSIIEIMIESEFRQRKKERQKKKQTKATDFFD